MSIAEIREWAEFYKKNLVMGALFVFVAAIGFALGYLAATEADHSPIVIEQGAAPVVPVKPPAPKVKTVVKQKQVPTVQPVIAPPVPVTTPVLILGGVSISEVMAGDSASGENEFIELYNQNAAAVDLTGWYVKKKSAGGAEAVFVSAARLQGKMVPVGKHFLIAREGSSLAPYADATWPRSNSVAYSNNTVALYNMAGEKISEVSWIKLDPGQSTTGVPSPQNSSQ